MYCQKCGASNQDDATFCSACGASLAKPVAGSAPSAPSYSPPTIQQKSPIIAAVLSFFLFGVGYLYLGYRRVLGVQTFAFVLIVLVLYIILGYFTFGLLELAIGIILAYDCYVKAKGQRGYLGTEPEYLYGSPAR
ncbi:MAG: zinc ribbon domain-containing protein [Nitrososphaerota archaeon]|nr:zinc ribbon domain-containing protein [Nitrososphaerota archaeon]